MIGKLLERMSYLLSLQALNLKCYAVLSEPELAFVSHGLSIETYARNLLWVTALRIF